jgi:hypothetical protein
MEPTRIIASVSTRFPEVEMTDHHAGDPGPRQMAETDLREAKAKFAEAKVDEAMAKGFDAQGDVFAALGAHDAANHAFAEAGNERAAEQRAVLEGSSHAVAAEQWSEAAHDLKEQSRLTGDAFAAGALAHTAQDRLHGGAELEDARRTELELQAASEAARQDVFVRRAQDMGTQAAEEAAQAEALDRSVQALEEADKAQQ